MSYEGNFTITFDVVDVDLVPVDGKLTVRLQNDASAASLAGEGLIVLDRWLPAYGRYPVAVDGGYVLTLPTDVDAAGSSEDSLVGYELTFETDAGTVIESRFKARPEGTNHLLSTLVGVSETLDLTDAQLIESVVAAALEDVTSNVYEAVAAGFARGQLVTHADYGAVGDGVTDDFAAIQACLLAVGASGGGVAAMPPLEFLMDTWESLLIPTNVTWAGAGDQTVVNFTYSSNTDPLHLITNADRTGGNSDITIQDMTIKGASLGGPTGVPSSPGVTTLFQRVDRVKVANVNYYRCRGPAVHFQGCTESRALNVKVRDCGRGGIVALSLPGRQLVDTLYAGCSVVGVGDDAYAISNTAASSALALNTAMVGCIADGVYQAAVNENEPDDGGRGVLLLGVDTAVVVGGSITNCASRAVLAKEHRGTNERSRNVTVKGVAGSRNSPVGSAQATQGMFFRNVDHLQVDAVIDGAGGSGVTIDNCTHVGGRLDVHNCGSALGHAAVNITGAGSDIDLHIDTYLNAGPGAMVTDATRVTLQGRSINNATAGAGSGANSAGVLLKTAGEVTLIGFRATDTRGTKLQTYGVACTTASPSRLTLIGGDYTGNLIGGLQFTTVPTTLVARGAVTSTTPGDNFDSDTSGARRGSGTGTPEGFKAWPVGSTYQRTDGGAGTSFYVKETGGSTNTGWVGK